jgi:hypothetical protein
MTGAAVELEEIDFRGDWREYAAGEEMKGCPRCGCRHFPV